MDLAEAQAWPVLALSVWLVVVLEVEQVQLVAQVALVLALLVWVVLVLEVEQVLLVALAAQDWWLEVVLMVVPVSRSRLRAKHQPAA